MQVGRPTPGLSTGKLRYCWPTLKSGSGPDPRLGSQKFRPVPRAGVVERRSIIETTQMRVPNIFPVGAASHCLYELQAWNRIGSPRFAPDYDCPGNIITGKICQREIQDLPTRDSIWITKQTKCRRCKIKLWTQRKKDHVAASIRTQNIHHHQFRCR